LKFINNEWQTIWYWKSYFIIVYRGRKSQENQTADKACKEALDWEQFSQRRVKWYERAQLKTS
jgi:hypothetical protein